MARHRAEHQAGKRRTDGASQQKRQENNGQSDIELTRADELIAAQPEPQPHDRFELFPIHVVARH